MKIKICLFLVLSLLALTTEAFCEDLVLENQTVYPAKDQKAKIAIQWASSAKEVDEANHAAAHGLELRLDSIKFLTQSGKVHIVIPDNAQYFRVLVWSTGTGNPDLLTNWVDVVPNKTFTLKADHLVPASLMAGTGC